MYKNAEGQICKPDPFRGALWLKGRARSGCPTPASSSATVLYPLGPQRACAAALPCPLPTSPARVRASLAAQAPLRPKGAVCLPAGRLMRKHSHAQRACAEPGVCRPTRGKRTLW